MFGFAIAMFVVAILAAIAGLTGLAAVATGTAKVVFIIALVLAAASWVVVRVRTP
jgi:uncharacterized membrane protein YtjA (UPF0391 family)